MTKDQATAFLFEAGHLIDMKVLDETFSRFSFKHGGTHITLCAFEDDADFLSLQCSYHLDDAVRDELEVARMVARLQRNYKVVKVDVSLDEPGAQGVSATAEQFVPDCNRFSSIFWRSVDLVVTVADAA